MSLKVLNLYAGIGGNRKLWDSVDVTAIEYNKDIAAVYQDLFPDDAVIITDAHQYLLDHFKEYDFIWASPPCPTHSRVRKASHNLKVGKIKPVYPDMRLYQEILLLDNYFDGLYCVENVIGYYTPLIKPQEINRHYFWANFHITPIRVKSFNIEHATTQNFKETIGFDLSPYRGIDKKNIMRNCVNPKVGEHIFNCARSRTQTTLS